MSVSPDYQNYTKCMEEIKRRQRAIDAILDHKLTTSYKYTNVEFVALQYRKIFELIVLASLTSHHHLFDGLVRKLSKEWQVTKIVEIVKKKNPDFYPKPIDRVPSKMVGAKDDWVDIKYDFLSLDELKAAHGQIGNLMHANNPYREAEIVDELEKLFPVWREKLIRLLNNHLIRFPGGKEILYVGMQSKETGSVHTALFGRMEV